LNAPGDGQLTIQVIVLVPSWGWEPSQAVERTVTVILYVAGVL
jgi:hypothetical protein